ncbi:MAG: DNA gyrase subunit A, partial [bacterium]|nr:DNA gyrase subunit A [bacterium]
LTKHGYIKRIELDNFSNIRRNGIIAIGLEDGDELCWVKLATAKDEIIIGTSCGMAIRFPIQDLRPLGRSARGVTSMKLRTGDSLIGCDVVPRDYDADLLLVTSDGFGKRSKLSEFRTQNRGGIGLIATKFKTSTSRLVALSIVEESDEIMLVTANGVVSRLKAGDISQQGRPATGVRAQNLVDGDSVASATKIINPDEDDNIFIKPAQPTEEAADTTTQTSLLETSTETTTEE